MTTPPLTVRAWKRFGHHRLYVQTDQEQQVGWMDIRTGLTTVERPDLEREFHVAITAHLLAHGAPPRQTSGPAGPASVPVPVVVPAVDPASTPDPVPVRFPASVEGAAWTDLALNRPGQAVRAEAEALLAEMRAGSRIGAFLARTRDDKTDERAFRVGADGEEAVGPRLERLAKNGWTVLHSIPVGKRGSDIDHLLIGPGGVFLVNTKNHPQAQVWVGEHSIQVNGRSTRYLRNSRFEAERVAKALGAQLGEQVPVRAVLVFLTGTVVPRVTIRQMPDDLVLHRLNLNRAFRRLPQVLTAEQVERLYAVARRSSTWG